jgi:hypothetical protein
VGRPEVGKLGEQIVVRTYPVLRDLPICEDSQEAILDVVGECPAIARTREGKPSPHFLNRSNSGESVFQWIVWLGKNCG